MISYCEYCGEYLGDYVDGKLYKFGKLVTEEHKCPGLIEPDPETIGDELAKEAGLSE